MESVVSQFESGIQASDTRSRDRDSERVGIVQYKSNGISDLSLFMQNSFMAWIETVPDDEWKDGPLSELLPQVVDPQYERVDHIMAVHSLNPEGLKAHLGIYRSAMSGTATLPKLEREMIALIVSLENHCHY